MALVGILPLADALNTIVKNRKCYVYKLKVGGQKNTLDLLFKSQKLD